mmetsp:Transcript_79991/g.231194  ORF Transcript_79991/g.231194 Transcript_79991/m.231194 type:complete len:214 (+) Transcript_79991:192-833(+)
MRLSESRPASSNSCSMSMGPAISATASSNHSRRSPELSSSTRTTSPSAPAPPSASQSSMALGKGSHEGTSILNAFGHSAAAAAATAGDAVMTACAPWKSSAERRAARSGTHTTPPAPTEAPKRARSACVTASAGGPATFAGQEGHAGVSPISMRILPMWTPRLIYSSALDSSEMAKLVTGSLGNSDKTSQTSSSNLRQRSGWRNMRTSKCAAA